MDIIEKEGLENPYELMKNNQWTWDKFMELCKAATKVASDGTIEQYGISASEWELGLFLMMSNGGKMIDEVSQKFVGDSPNTIEALEFLHSLYSVEKVLKVGGEERETFLEGQSLFTPVGTWFAGTIQEKGIKFGFIPMPKGPKGERYQSVGFGPNMYFVPKGANYEMLTIYAESRREALSYTPQNPDLWAERFAYDEESFDYLTSMRENYFANVIDRSDGFGVRQIVPWIEIMNGEAQAASSIESIKAQAQALIDEIFAD